MGRREGQRSTETDTDMHSHAHARSCRSRVQESCTGLPSRTAPHGGHFSLASGCAADVESSRRAAVALRPGKRCGSPAARTQCARARRGGGGAATAASAPAAGARPLPPGGTRPRNGCADCGDGAGGGRGLCGTGAPTPGTCSSSGVVVHHPCICVYTCVLYLVVSIVCCVRVCVCVYVSMNVC